LATVVVPAIMPGGAFTYWLSEKGQLNSRIAIGGDGTGGSVRFDISYVLELHAAVHGIRRIARPGADDVLAEAHAAGAQLVSQALYLSGTMADADRYSRGTEA
jgi:hypothetical protein